MKRWLSKVDEGKLISIQGVWMVPDGKIPMGTMSSEQVKMALKWSKKLRGFHKRNRRANRKVSRGTTAGRLWQIFVRRVKNA